MTAWNAEAMSDRERECYERWLAAAIDHEDPEQAFYWQQQGLAAKAERTGYPAPDPRLAPASQTTRCLVITAGLTVDLSTGATAPQPKEQTMNTTTTTTTIEPMLLNKTEVIDALRAGGDTRSARALRDVRLADLRAALAVQIEQAAKKAKGSKKDPEQPAPASVEDIDPKGPYTVADIAAVVGLTKFAVRRWVRLGYLANVEVDGGREGQFHVSGADLISFLRSREEKVEEEQAS